MATIVKTSLARGDSAALTFTALTGTDDFEYNNQANEILIMENTTGGDVTVTFDGANGTTENCPGVGEIDVSAGIALTVTANSFEQIQLSSISAYLQGTVAVTGGTGVSAAILVA